MIKLPSYNMLVAKADGKYVLNSMSGSASDNSCGYDWDCSSTKT